MGDLPKGAPPPGDGSVLAANLARVRARIEAALDRSGRPAGSVGLVAVTKSVEPETAATLVRLGQLDLGENRADELERKARALADLGLEPRWHFIGHLQTNKVRRVVAHAGSIHSIDSMRLLEAVDAAAGAIGTRPEIWIQAKLSEEPTKTGADPGDAIELVARARELRHVRLAGLMTIAPLAGPGSSGREASARAAFRALAELAREAGMGDALRSGPLRTSMGMSDDFEWAIEEGSDLVRVGTLLFDGASIGGEASA
jgi:pyridoxal phosphate enzyme (YggS family)